MHIAMYLYYTKNLLTWSTYNSRKDLPRRDTSRIMLLVAKPNFHQEFAFYGFSETDSAWSRGWKLFSVASTLAARTCTTRRGEMTVWIEVTQYSRDPQPACTGGRQV